MGKASLLTEEQPVAKSGKFQASSTGCLSLKSLPGRWAVSGQDDSTKNSIVAGVGPSPQREAPTPAVRPLPSLPALAFECARLRATK